MKKLYLLLFLAVVVSILFSSCGEKNNMHNKYQQLYELAHHIDQDFGFSVYENDIQIIPEKYLSTEQGGLVEIIKGRVVLKDSINYFWKTDENRIKNFGEVVRKVNDKQKSYLVPISVRYKKEIDDLPSSYLVSYLTIELFETESFLSFDYPGGPKKISGFDRPLRHAPMLGIGEG